MILLRSLFRVIQPAVILLVTVVALPSARAQSLHGTLQGTVLDERGVPLNVPVLLQLTDASSDSIVATSWSDEAGQFQLNFDGIRRVRLIASRFGRAATYRVETIVDTEADNRSSIAIVLPEPVSAAVMPVSGTYHDKNRALTEGMLAGARIDLAGKSRHTVFEASPPSATIRLVSRTGLVPGTRLRLTPVGADGQGLASGAVEKRCPTLVVCYLNLEPGFYQLELKSDSDLQQFEISIEYGLTTIWIE